mgnify:FL=1|tara:strand:- start:200 stop:895 length:696 start_codon:yes stop_codon:yes gene_type:complete
MKNKNEKGFALVLSLVLLLAMSLMGGALIVISAGDHQSNNTNDEYQQTFYVAETALIEGEKYLLNNFLGPYYTSGSNLGSRNQSARNLPANQSTNFTGTMVLKNYTPAEAATWTGISGFSTGNTCFNSFKDIDRSDFKVVVAESWNFGDLLKDSLGSELNSKEESKLRSYYYEFFLTRIGAAPFRGSGTSIKKKATDTGNDGMAYRIYGCGIRQGADRLIVPLESTVVLPK